MSCPDSDKVYRLLDGPCGTEDQQWLESHLAGCAECRQELERATERIRRPPPSDAEEDRKLAELQTRLLRESFADRPAAGNR